MDQLKLLIIEDDIDQLGDEFVLLLPHADGDAAAGVMGRIREEYRSASAAALRRPDGVSMSAGVASLRLHEPAHADQLVAMADAALYQAKEAGRNRTSILRPVAATVGQGG